MAQGGVMLEGPEAQQAVKLEALRAALAVGLASGPGIPAEEVLTGWKPKLLQWSSNIYRAASDETIRSEEFFVWLRGFTGLFDLLVIDAFQGT